MPSLLKKVFQKYSLPIDREEKNIYSFLEKHFKSYTTDLDALLEMQYFDKKHSSNLTKAKKLITSFSQDILTSIDLYFQGYSSESYIAFAERMDKIQEYLVYKEITRNSEFRFCRIRIDKGETWKDLFHIPFDKREIVKGYRYSIAGFPSLYLAANGNFNSYARPLDYDAALSLAWFETGMPAKFYWSKFKLKSIEPLKILDLTLSPFSSIPIRNKIYTSISNQQPIEDFIMRALITYPLTASCSLIAESKNRSFVPEYIIPQMLLSWVRKNADCRGVAYLSSSHIKHAQIYNAFNVVLPPVSVESSGYCKKLRGEFSVFKPRVVDISGTFKQLNTQLDAVRRFRVWLNKICKNKLATDSFREILSICNSFICIYEEVRDKKIKDIECIYQQLETLNLWAQRITTEKYHEIMIEEVKQFSPNDANALKICEKTWTNWKTTQESLRDFWTFDMKYFQ